ncbi:MAG: hypothetical protein EOS22_06220 [Mesorhizobium sp.]|nr:MAG: hypothetical protein EOS22_06220 [Mesorhizobium sp.]TJW66522.1 MAG: hypothetical protein E5V29_21925 [Mesorhizobium sp.]
MTLSRPQRRSELSHTAGLTRRKIRRSGGGESVPLVFWHDRKRPGSADDPLAQPNFCQPIHQVREADITGEQARELTTLIGTDWKSLLGEAQFLKARRRL